MVIIEREPIWVMCAQKGCALGREFTDFGGTLTVTRKLKAAGDGGRNACVAK
ncbi:MAG: hypothetical protein ACLT49_06805 [Sutterella wadsworthensis]